MTRKGYSNDKNLTSWLCPHSLLDEVEFHDSWGSRIGLEMFLRSGLCLATESVPHTGLLMDAQDLDAGLAGKIAIAS